jgi:glutamyl-Q tRNA(Asp) synthetase
LPNPHKNNLYRGRFAPSPSGSLHFGSLLAATASYLDAKAHQGSWLLRIEDLDLPRVRRGAVSAILNILECYGFAWDENILYQSQRFSVYQESVDELLTTEKAYWCSCSRKLLQQTAQLGSAGLIYPRHCQQGLYQTASPLRTVRLHCNNSAIQFKDRLYGRQQQCIASEVGDFVIRRSDAVYSYQLAVVIDDNYQGISDVIRGYDLLNNTARQIYLQQLLNYATPRYLHIPIAVDKNGNKLSKRNLAKALECQDALGNIYQALCFLGQNPPRKSDFSTLADLWKWAIMHWNIANLPTQGTLPYEFR